MPPSELPHVSGDSSAKSAALKSARRIERLLEEGRAHTTLSRAAFFTQALRVWDAMLRETDLDEYLNTICVGVEQAMTQIVQAFELLLAEATMHYLDVLALVFLLYGLRASEGEEYTPWDSVQVMVRIAMRDFRPPAPGDPPCTFYDPCCGSGSLLLGCMEYLDATHPEVLDRNQARFYGQDVRYEAGIMARINIRLHVLGRALRRQERRPPSGDAPAEVAAPDHPGVEPPTASPPLSSPPAREPSPGSCSSADLASPGSRKAPPDGLGALFPASARAEHSDASPFAGSCLPGCARSPEAELTGETDDDLPSP